MIVVHLLGRPSIESEVPNAVTPRGQKVWAVLAYLRLAERAVSRAQLAQLLFADAADPLGALRWTLGELRRALAGHAEISGDPLQLRLDADVRIDVDELMGHEPDVLGTGEFLHGLSLDGCPEFESWMLVTRHRLSATVEARLRRRTIELLALGDTEQAVTTAQLLVERQPLDEGSHELLVRSLAATGDQAAAQRQLALCADLFARELGVEVSGALREAVFTVPASATTRPLAGRAGVMSQLEAGRAAITAGALEAGVQCLRRAALDAGRLGDDGLRARTLLALGTALVHTLRGRDSEGAIVLEQAALAAENASDRTSLVAARRELGYVEVQAGRHLTAHEMLTKAAAIAETDDESAGVLAMLGMNASDAADYPSALNWLGESIERAAACGDDRQRAWSLSVLGRAHLLRADYHQARVTLDQCMQLVTTQQWLAFLPWPLALRAELRLIDGEAEAASYDFEHAWSLACTLNDPCWEAMAARGIALVHHHRGDPDAAREWLADAAVRCVRVTDPYRWVQALVLDTTAEIAIAAGDAATAHSAVLALTPLAARCGLRELTVRALLHRHALDDDSALASARLAAEDIDNPHLHKQCSP